MLSTNRSLTQLNLGEIKIGYAGFKPLRAVVKGREGVWFFLGLR